MPYIYKSPRSVLGASFTLYAFFAFFIYLGDAIMAYATPIFLDQKISDPAMVGIIFSFSSIAGLAFNFIGGELLGNKSANFFLKTTLYFAVLFPGALLLGANYIPMYLLGMAAWGIYFETQAYTTYKYIELTKKKEEFTEAWGVMSIVMSLAYFTGPLIATYLAIYLTQLNFYAALLCYFWAYLVFLYLSTKAGLKHKASKPSDPVSPIVELKRWKIFLKRLWPLWTFSLSLYIIEAFFWTIGVVYAESLKGELELAGLMISLHVLPTFIIGMFMSRVKIKEHKKKIALLSALVAGGVLTTFGFANDVYQILGIVVVYSAFSAVSFNLLWATYEDYVAREESYETDLIGLERSASSVAYIIGPILGGFLAQQFGEKTAIATAGSALMFVSLLIFLIVPKKIKMPHSQLDQLS